MIAKGSLPLILIPLIPALIFIFLMFIPIAIIFILIFLFFIIFFRDPERAIGDDIVSPADGKISIIEKKSDYVRISIVMSLFNVHVNRASISGKVTSIVHYEGKHVPAFSKDSEANERVQITLSTKLGEVKIIQIAGIFARRIVTYINKGDNLQKGQRIGIIRFGSRVDLYLPKKSIKLKVKVGDKTRAGKTSLALVVKDEG